MKTQKQRSVVLSSRIARDILSGKAAVPEFSNLFGVIDTLGEVRDGLAALRSSPDPLKTRELQAVEYRGSYDKASRHAEGLISQATSRLSDLMGRTVASARLRAGVAAEPEKASEIRQALRGMSKTERDRAIRGALADGDRQVLASIRDQPSVLIGETEIAVDHMIDVFVRAQVPELADDLAAIETGLQNLEMAAVAFRREAAGLRDLDAERAADEGHDAHKRALGSLMVGLQRNPETRDAPAD